MIGDKANMKYKGSREEHHKLLNRVSVNGWRTSASKVGTELSEKTCKFSNSFVKSETKR